jgi:hypothetical protein
MSKIGRPSKGDRVVTYARPHRLVRESCEASALAQGYDSLSDYIAAVLAHHQGLPELAPLPRPRGGEDELPMTG